MHVLLLKGTPSQDESWPENVKWAALSICMLDLSIFIQQKYLFLLNLGASGCSSTPGGVDVTCISTHARWELQQATEVFVVVLVWCLLSANQLPCVLMLLLYWFVLCQRRPERSAASSTTHADLVHVTDTNCQIQNGSVHSSISPPSNVSL